MPTLPCRRCRPQERRRERMTCLVHCLPVPGRQRERGKKEEGKEKKKTCALRGLHLARGKRSGSSGIYRELSPTSKRKKGKKDHARTQLSAPSNTEPKGRVGRKERNVARLVGHGHLAMRRSCCFWLASALWINGGWKGREGGGKKGNSGRLVGNQNVCVPLTPTATGKKGKGRRGSRGFSSLAQRGSLREKKKGSRLAHALRSAVEGKKEKSGLSPRATEVVRKGKKDDSAPGKSLPLPSTQGRRRSGAPCPILRTRLPAKEGGKIVGS